MSLANEMQSQFSAQQVAGIVGSQNNALTAAGTTQATATVAGSQYNRVTTAGAAGAPFAGVILPISKGVGDEVEVVNVTTVNIAVYPPVGGKLNGNAVNVPLIMAPLRCHTFFCVDGTSWDVDSI